MHPGDSLRVLIVGGGTGGHVMPALAIAKELRDRYRAEVRLLGTPRGIETKLVPEAGFPLELMRVGQLANVSLFTRVKTLTDLPRGILNCVYLIRSFRPHVVVGVGGYASGPAMLAALLLRVPTLVYEPNAVPGMVNRALGKRVSDACVAFESTQKFFRVSEVTGVPVRPEIAATGPLVTHPPRLLVTAGSNGATVFNEILPLIAKDLLAAAPGLTVIHQTGDRACASTGAAYRANDILPDQVDVVPFLRDMPAQLDRATLVLSRSGSTVAELAAAGRPALLVPFPQAADDHQTKNAEAMVSLGAAVLLPQAQLTPAVLLHQLTRLLQNPDRLNTMSQAARAAGKPHALARIAEKVVALAR